MANPLALSAAELAGMDKEALLETVFDLQRLLTQAQDLAAADLAKAEKRAADREAELSKELQSLRVQVNVLQEENRKLTHAMRRSTSSELVPSSTSALGLPKSDSLFSLVSELQGKSGRQRYDSWSDMIRRKSKLFIKVCEAKDLPKRSSVLPSIMADKTESAMTYVQVSADDQEIGRTKPATKTGFHLWNEEFDVQLVTAFRMLNIVVWLKSKSKNANKDTPLAQASIKYEALVKDGTKHEDWYPLFVPRKAKHTSFFGALQAEVVLSRPDAEQLTLLVRVIAARNLVEREDSVLPAASVYVALHIVPDDELQTTAQTRVCTADACDPVFNDTFTFKVTPRQLSESKLHMSVWNGTTKGMADDFLGQVIVPVAEFSVLASQPMGENGHWFPLTNRNDAVSASGRLQTGSKKISGLNKSEPGKLSRSQGNLVSVIRASSSMAEVNAGNENKHDFYPLKPTDESGDCEQCGWHASATSVKCKVCGIISHDGCRTLLTSPCATAGSIRLSYRYEQGGNFAEEILLPYGAYNDLMTLLSEDHELLVLNTLGSICDVDRLNELAKCSLNVFEAQGSSIRFIKQLISSEIYSQKDATTLFRGNTIATKCVDYWMHMIGHDYLVQVLKKPINDIFSEKKTCELDESRLDKSKSDVAANRKNLIRGYFATEYLRKILDAIFSSLDECPMPIREVLGHLQSDVIAKFPNERDIRYSAVGGFIFLRYFCPAILGPKLFGLRTEFADANTSRTLTLATKVLQNLANLVDFGMKEPYMLEMNDFIREKREMMMGYIDALVLNRSALLMRVSELETELHHDQQHIEGGSTLERGLRTLKSKHHMEAAKERLALRRKDIELLRQMADMDSTKGTKVISANEVAKRSIDLEMQLSRLHGHIRQKRPELIAALEAIGTQESIVASRRLIVVLDELDGLSSRLQETEAATNAAAQMARDRAGVNTVFY